MKPLLHICEPSGLSAVGPQEIEMAEYRWNQSELTVGYDAGAVKVHPYDVKLQDVILNSQRQPRRVSGRVFGAGHDGCCPADRPGALRPTAHGRQPRRVSGRVFGAGQDGCCPATRPGA